MQVLVPPQTLECKFLAKPLDLWEVLLEKGIVYGSVVVVDQKEEFSLEVTVEQFAEHLNAVDHVLFI